MTPVPFKLKFTPVEAIEKWIAALRSGTYQQGRNRLIYTSQGKTTYCCLGVLCEVMGVPKSATGGFQFGENGTSNSHLPGLWLLKTLHLHSEQYELSHRNDSGWSFSTIAYYIETHILPAVQPAPQSQRSGFTQDSDPGDETATP